MGLAAWLVVILTIELLVLHLAFGEDQLEEPRGVIEGGIAALITVTLAMTTLLHSDTDSTFRWPRGDHRYFWFGLAIIAIGGLVRFLHDPWTMAMAWSAMVAALAVWCIGLLTGIPIVRADLDLSSPETSPAQHRTSTRSLMLLTAIVAMAVVVSRGVSGSTQQPIYLTFLLLSLSFFSLATIVVMLRMWLMAVLTLPVLLYFILLISEGFFLDSSLRNRFDDNRANASLISFELHCILLMAMIRVSRYRWPLSNPRS